MTENIIFKNRKIGKVISYLKEKQYQKKDLYEAKNDFVDFLAEEISFISNNYAGFQSKARFKKFIINSVFDFKKSENAKKNYYDRFPNRKIISVIEKSLQSAYAVLPLGKVLKIFIFPTLQKFVRDKMDGSTGYTPSGDFVHIYLSPGLIKPSIFNAVRKTIVHEYNHAVRFQYFPNLRPMSLLESLIFEGLAENFTTELIDGKLSPWAKVFNKNSAKKTFEKIKTILNSRDKKVYYSVFFENKKFPLWAGYSIGYWIIRDFKKRNQNIAWPEISRMSYQEIFKSSDWQ